MVIFIKFCLLIHFNIVWSLVCSTVTRLRRAISGLYRSMSENAHNSLTAWYILIRFYILVHFKTDTGMLNGDEASPSISLADFDHLVKMLM